MRGGTHSKMNCPACDRYIGSAGTCPYCTLSIPMPPSCRLLKTTAWLVAVAGLALLWKDATTREPPFARITGITAVMDFTRSHIKKPAAENGPVGHNPAFIRIHTVVRPHLHWIAWCVIAYILMAEWPRPENSGQAGLIRFIASHRSTGTDMLVLLLSGLLGFILFQRTPASAAACFQNLMLAFIGLFTIPRLMIHLADGTYRTPPLLNSLLPFDTGSAPPPPLSRLTLMLSSRIGRRRISAAALVLIAVAVGVFTGTPGLVTLPVAVGTGILAVLYEAQRLCCVGFILLPIACHISGVNPAIATFLHLL